MLGKTAGALFWMFRYMERCENTARLVEAGFYIALTRSQSADDEWASIIQSSGNAAQYDALHEHYNGPEVINFLLREKSNPSSVLSMIELARSNARMARTALTREVWEAVNEAWLDICASLKADITPKTLPGIIGLIRRRSALVQGALHGTMLRNDIYDFARLGTYIERAESTARILDVKYYVLLPSVSVVGGPMDNVQWETILRCVSAERSYRWVTKGAVTPRGIADFLILDRTMPRSLATCEWETAQHLFHLSNVYGSNLPSQKMAADILGELSSQNIDAVFDYGLHEFIGEFLVKNQMLAAQIEADYRFTN